MFAAHVFWEYGYSWGPTAGASMLPTFDIQGDYALVDKRYRLGRNIAVGDLVNYRIPIFKNSDGVKRVIGMPGDYVLVNSPDAPGDMMIQVPKALLVDCGPLSGIEHVKNASDKKLIKPDDGTGRETWEMG
ncbi:Mitochondrial inner membrane protease subunit 1 [Colletotrichum orbiculare MAFF 240422]|uniref:Mitochondrial inner membrane protease subunit 1 n=1 Tax=Colletotrichum orbiculare (strain 104-T / ATCC 96160 / CBS 514.97 / LARS 414 / MAFF 240422) TaxID=1213857 RepID=A0A484FMA6_COLOR|nr:Mitochondrial inner membrane protease subunit 1 [Colletotrichum orbiculare MAFF 240422]